MEDVKGNPATDVGVATDKEVQGPEKTPPAVDSKEGKIDWWEPKTWGKTSPSDVVKQIQGEYQTKTEKLKKTEKDYQSLKEELEQTASIIRQSLADPKAYHAYRKQLGYATEEPTKTDIPKMPNFTEMNTVDDVSLSFKNMFNWFEGRIKEVESKAEARAENKIRAAVDPISKERWSNALSSVKEKYGEKWDGEVERKVVSAITSGRYAYRPGEEKILLDKTFRAECPEVYESYIQGTFVKKAEEKKKTATVPPKSSAMRPMNKTGNAASDVIARVNARLGPNTFRHE